MKNHTLVDWFDVSGGIHFEPDSKDEIQIYREEEKDKGSERG